MSSNVFIKFVSNSLISKAQIHGKKEFLEIIFKQNIALLKKYSKLNPLYVLFFTFQQVKPFCEIKSLKIGGKLYKIPVEIKSKKQNVLILKWLFSSISERNEHFIEIKVMKEVLDTYHLSSKTINLCENFHKMSEINKIYMQFRF